jgi:hypothetical protein
VGHANRDYDVNRGVAGPERFMMDLTFPLLLFVPIALGLVLVVARWIVVRELNAAGAARARERDKRADALLDRQEALLDRVERLLDRAEAHSTSGTTDDAVRIRR